MFMCAKAESEVPFLFVDKIGERDLIAEPTVGNLQDKAVIFSELAR